MELGPVEYAVIAFPGSEFSGRIVPALNDLIRQGTIRLIDLTFITKAPDGSVEAFELDALPETITTAYDALDGEVSGLLSAEDIADLAEAVPPGSSAAIVVWEDSWARSLAQAARESGGVLVTRETVPHEVVQAAVAVLESGAA
ncbi:DUF6325 family protein [Streptacidiphilus fuscans]|uniref:DUF1269 domain-containing protein n=1 Tax=Streptacidiphilus fuscans TaxID=2789292 RepID=A0A931B0X1_9ACTN|nr:DUF6325 family protein [Streptacidiphilus fuscans]MBF9066901.1 hypothetical protein [Streptacidiphilus fuscans]